MDRYQEALHFLSLDGDCNDTECKKCSIKKICHKYLVIQILQEVIDKANTYDELQKVYFKNEPMESADLNGVKLQELYDFCSKLIDKEIPKTTKTKMNEHNHIDRHCPICDSFVYSFDIYCGKCGQRIRSNE